MKRLEIIYIVCILYFLAKNYLFFKIDQFYLYVSNKNSFFALFKIKIDLGI